MRVTPDVHYLIGVGDPQFANPETARKAESILSHDSDFVLTGVAITNKRTGELVIVHDGRSRWLNPNDLAALLNPPHPTMRLKYE